MSKPHRSCCLANLKCVPGAHYCPTCGDTLTENHSDPSREPSEYMCRACNDGGSYRLVYLGVAVYCPNCGQKTSKGLHDPKGYYKTLNHPAMR